MRRGRKSVSILVCAAIVLSLLSTAVLIVPNRASAAASFKFDFGSGSSPVASGYTRISNTTVFSSSTGYGLAAAIDERDRGAPDDLRRDFVISGSDYTFSVNLPNGEYRVKAIAGDQIASNRTTVHAEGVEIGTIATGSGSFGETEGAISVTDGQLNIAVSGIGKRLNAIEITPLSLKFDFGSSSSPVAAGYTQVTNGTVYTSSAGFGLSASIDQRDRGGPDDLRRDFVISGSDYTFHIDLPNGEYQVKIIAGDQIASNRTTVTAEGALLGSTSNGSGSFGEINGTVAVSDGQMNLVISGNDKRLNGVEISEAGSAGERPRQMELLNRSPVAVKVTSGVYVGWRMLGTDPADIAFHVYRNGQRITGTALTTSTNYLDPQGTEQSVYEIRPVIGGSEQAGETTSVWGQNYMSVPLQKPPGGVTPAGESYTYSANDASVGDLDGDGQYEIILKWDPSNSKDNSQSGYTGNVYVDAYKPDGTRLWRIDLGRNIRAGAHYTQFMVYDLDGNGRSEIVMKTADGTIDGQGAVIGNANADYRNSSGYILSGPEYLTVFDGLTGRALATTDYIPQRGNVSSWGDSYGNRVDRFLAGVAYLDGERPSIVMARGYYTRTVLAAFNWRNGQLTHQWTFDSNQSGNGGYAGQGFHSLSVADVDEDGKDEIVYGNMVVNDDGTGLYSTGLGHGDAMHVSDLDIGRPGLEVFTVHESTNAQYGYMMRDARTGQILWGVPTGADMGRGLASDIDPRYPGAEAWARGTNGGLYRADGTLISTSAPPANFAVWWDGDLSRELLDHNWSGSAGVGVGTIMKWDYENNRTVNLLTATGTNSNNWTKGNPSLQADLFGDWREEVIWRTSDSNQLRIYTTTDVTQHRIFTLMHDPVYRLGIAWQNVAYNQPPHTGYFLGNGMSTPPMPNIAVN
ncbi:rhamnogalacturonan lyase [Paenibacillus tarimensis]